jgi:hypothetical protein
MAHNPAGVYQQLVGDERDVDERPTAAAFHPDPTDGVYRYGPRERRDVTYAWIYGTVASVVFILGCVASTNAESSYEKLADPNLLKLASHCDAGRAPEAFDAYRRSLAEDEEVDGAVFLRHAATWLVLSTLGAVAVGLGFLAMFRTHAQRTVWAMVYFKVASIFTLALVVGYVHFIRIICFFLIKIWAIVLTSCFVYHMTGPAALTAQTAADSSWHSSAASPRSCSGCGAGRSTSSPSCSPWRPSHCRITPTLSQPSWGSR